jgi:hypothetical protein
MAPPAHDTGIRRAAARPFCKALRDRAARLPATAGVDITGALDYAWANFFPQPGSASRKRMTRDEGRTEGR